MVVLVYLIVQRSSCFAAAQHDIDLLTAHRYFRPRGQRSFALQPVIFAATHYLAFIFIFALQSSLHLPAGGNLPMDAKGIIFNALL